MFYGCSRKFLKVVAGYKSTQGWAPTLYPRLNDIFLVCSHWTFRRDVLDQLKEPAVIFQHIFAHRHRRLFTKPRLDNILSHFSSNNPPVVIVDPWVSLVPALKQQLTFPLPHSSPKCFQWRRKQHLPEGCMHMKYLKKSNVFLFLSLFLFDWHQRNIFDVISSEFTYSGLILRNNCGAMTRTSCRIKKKKKINLRTNHIIFMLNILG